MADTVELGLDIARGRDVSIWESAEVELDGGGMEGRIVLLPRQ